MVNEFAIITMMVTPGYNGIVMIELLYDDEWWLINGYNRNQWSVSHSELMVDNSHDGSWWLINDDNEMGFGIWDLLTNNDG